MASDIDPEILKSVHPRWSRTGMFWGPICPQDESHGGLLDIHGSENWYCRHSSHQGGYLYSYNQLVELEINRITADEKTAGEDPQESQPLPEE